MKRDLTIGSIGLILGLLLAAIICVWKAKPNPSTIPVISPEIANLPTIHETLSVRTYPGIVNKKLGVPTTDKVLTSTKLVATNSPQTITAAIDSEGTTRLYLRNDALPWFSRSHRQSVEFIYGIMDQSSVKRLEYRYELFRVKQLDFGLSAGANILSAGPSRALVGLSMSYSW